MSSYLLLNELISGQYVRVALQIAPQSMYSPPYPEGRDKFTKLIIYLLKFIDSALTIYK